MSTTSMAIFSNPLFATYSVYARNASFVTWLVGCWRRSIVVRTLVSAGELSLSYARLLAGWVTTLWLSRPLSVSQHGQLSLLLASLWGN